MLLWQLHDNEDDVKALSSLPQNPFPDCGDATRTRHEFKQRFVVRSCFKSWEDSLLTTPATRISILGPKGSGKTTFLRWFVHKHCHTRLFVYLHDSVHLVQLNKDCVPALIFGLQALGPENAAAVALLAVVRVWSEDTTSTCSTTSGASSC